jgi:DnaK suppressor protein
VNAVAFREAQTDERYMTPRQLQYFREKLLRWRSELCRQRPGFAADHDDPGLQPDWVDSASFKSDWNLSQARQERTVDTLR